MGKAKIVSHIADSEYNIIYYHDLTIVNTRLAQISNAIAEIDASLVDVDDKITVETAKIGLLKSDFDTAIILYNYCISINEAEECSDEKDLIRTSNIIYIDQITAIDLLKLEKENLQVYRNRLLKAQTEYNGLTGEESMTAWCIDLCDRLPTEPDAGDWLHHGEIIPVDTIVGTIEVFNFSSGEYNVNIVAGSYARNPAYVEANDGISGHSITSNGEGFVYNYNMRGPQATWNPNYRIARINSISAGLAQLTYRQNKDQDNVKFNTMDDEANADIAVDYMKCSSSPPFKANDDVVVKFGGDKMSLPLIVGYLSNPQACEELLEALFSTDKATLFYYPDKLSSQSTACSNAGLDLDDIVDPSVLTNPAHATYWSYNAFASDNSESTVTYSQTIGRYSHNNNQETDYGIVLNPCLGDKFYYLDGVQLHGIASSTMTEYDALYAEQGVEQIFRTQKEQSVLFTSRTEVLKTWSFTSNNYLTDLILPEHTGRYTNCSSTPQKRSIFSRFLQDNSGDNYIVMRIDRLVPDDSTFCSLNTTGEQEHWDLTSDDGSGEVADTVKYFLEISNVSTDFSTGLTTADFITTPARTGYGLEYNTYAWSDDININVQDIRMMAFDSTGSNVTVTTENSGTATNSSTSDWVLRVDEETKDYTTSYKINGSTKFSGRILTSLVDEFTCPEVNPPGGMTCANIQGEHSAVHTLSEDNEKYFVCIHRPEIDLLIYAKITHTRSVVNTEDFVAGTWSQDKSDQVNCYLYVEYKGNTILIDTVSVDTGTVSTSGSASSGGILCTPESCRNPGAVATSYAELPMMVPFRYNSILIALDSTRADLVSGENYRTSAIISNNEFQVDYESGLLSLSTTPGLLSAIFKSGTSTEEFLEQEWLVYSDTQRCNMERKAYNRIITPTGSSYDPMSNLFPGAVQSDRFCMDRLGLVAPHQIP